MSVFNRPFNVAATALISSSAVRKYTLPPFNTSGKVTSGLRNFFCIDFDSLKLIIEEPLTDKPEASSAL